MKLDRPNHVAEAARLRVSSANCSELWRARLLGRSQSRSRSRQASGPPPIAPLCALAPLRLCAILCSALAAATQAETIVRYDTFLVFKAKPGETVPLRVESVPKAKFTYGDVPRVVVIDSKSRPAIEADLGLGQTRVFQYQPATDGLHALCLFSKNNVARAAIEGRPWAFVARAEAPLNVSRQCDPLHFAPPAGLKQFRIFVHAWSVGEAARVVVTDPDGNTALDTEGDYNKATALPVKPAKPTDGRPWRIDVLAPKTQGWGLDDVKLWLGPELQPLLCLEPEWLAEFEGLTGQPPEHISQRIIVSDAALRLPKNASKTIRFTLAAVPSAKVTALRVLATDIDYRHEAPASLNGVEFFLPVNGDGITSEVTVRVAPGTLKLGENTLVLRQDPSGGSGVYSVRQVELLFGDKINCD